MNPTAKDATVAQDPEAGAGPSCRAGSGGDLRRRTWSMSSSPSNRGRARGHPHRRRHGRSSRSRSRQTRRSSSSPRPPRNEEPETRNPHRRGGPLARNGRYFVLSLMKMSILLFATIDETCRRPLHPIFNRFNQSDSLPSTLSYNQFRISR